MSEGKVTKAFLIRKNYLEPRKKKFREGGGVKYIPQLHKGKHTNFFYCSYFLCKFFSLMKFFLLYGYVGLTPHPPPLLVIRRPKNTYFLCLPIATALSSLSV